MRKRYLYRPFALLVFSNVVFSVQFPPAQGVPPGGRPARPASPPVSSVVSQPHLDPGGPAEEIVLPLQSSRPLDAAIRELQWFGIPISYEEPVWQSKDDVVPQGPATGNPFRDPDILVPAPAGLLLRFQVDAATRTHLRTPLVSVLIELVSRHTAVGNPGEFRVIDLGQDHGYSVVPIRVKDSSGTMVSATSPLDALVSIPSKGRTFEESLEAFTSAVSQSFGRKVVFFDARVSQVIAENHSEPIYMFGADNELARNVLSRFLRQVFPQKLSWRLVHQPGKPGTPPPPEYVPGRRGAEPPKLLTGTSTAVQQITRGSASQRPVEDYYGLSFVPVVRQVDRTQLKADGSGCPVCALAKLATGRSCKGEIGVNRGTNG